MFTIQIIASTYAGLLAATSMLQMVYIICLIVGGGLLMISTFLGGDSDVAADADVEMDFDADVDVEVEADAHVEGADVAATGSLSLANWFSMRFVVYFMAAFGLVDPRQPTLRRYDVLSETGRLQHHLARTPAPCHL